MQFKIQKTEQGQFEIIQTMPVVVGSFPDQKMARKVFDFLVDDYMEAMPAVAPAPVELALVDEKPPETAPETATPPQSPAPKKPKRKPAQLKSVPVQGDIKIDNAKPLDWTEEEVDAALVRLLAGERLKDVAESYGKGFNSLRGKWANYKRYHKTGLVKTLTKPEINDADHDDCRLCGKSFMPTPDSLDLCARCNRDT